MLDLGLRNFDPPRIVGLVTQVIGAVGSAQCENPELGFRIKPGVKYRGPEIGIEKIGGPQGPSDFTLAGKPGCNISQADPTCDCCGEN
jgi:hypothetical protein